jgi:hypothetical protein
MNGLYVELGKFNHLGSQGSSIHIWAVSVVWLPQWQYKPPAGPARPAGSISLALRYRLLASRCAALLSLSLIHSDRVSPARSAASRYVSCSGSATRIVKNLLGDPVASSFGRPRVSIGEVYQQKTFSQGRDIPCDLSFCWYTNMQQLGVMAQQKNPVKPCRVESGQQQSGGYGRMLRHFIILAREAAPVKGESN